MIGKAAAVTRISQKGRMYGHCRGLDDTKGYLGKESTCQCWRCKKRRFPLRVGMENSMDMRTGWAAVYGGAKSRKTRLNAWARKRYERVPSQDCLGLFLSS